MTLSPENRTLVDKLFPHQVSTIDYENCGLTVSQLGEALAKARAQPLQEGWKLIDHHPLPGFSVLLARLDGFRVEIGMRINNGRWRTNAGEYSSSDGDVSTHWMPLPAPPHTAKAPS